MTFVDLKDGWIHPDMNETRMPSFLLSHQEVLDIGNKLEFLLISDRRRSSQV